MIQEINDRILVVVVKAHLNCTRQQADKEEKRLAEWIEQRLQEYDRTVHFKQVTVN